jgi:iron complex outermembrane receptor protein
MFTRKTSMSMMHRGLAVSAVVFLLPTTCLTAWSAEPKVEVSLDQVVVTAQKRVEDMQDVGISVATLSGDQLESLGVSSAIEVPNFIPGVRLVQPNGAGTYSFSVRGVTQNDVADHQESPTAIYVDDVYVSQMAGLALQMFDTDRVEILRGPQGTLFGRNATGGLAHFISRRPSEETKGYFKATVGEYNLVRTEGAIGGKLFGNSNVLGRLAFTTNNHDGLFENTNTGRDSENGNDKAIRGQLLFNLPGDSSLLLIGRYGNKDVRAGAWESIPSSLGPDGNGVFGATTNNFGLGASGDFKTIGDAKGYAKINTGGVTAKFDTFISALDDAQLTAIVDYQNLRKKYFEDSDTTPIPIAHVFNSSDVDQYSAEVRLAGQKNALKWIGGAYYLKIDGRYTEGAQGTFLGGLLFDPYTLKTESYAVFGQADYALTERLGLTAGARYTVDKKDFNYISTIAGATVYEFTPTTVGGQTHLDDGFWSGKLGLDYKLSPSSLLYASYNRGSKGGGFNAPAAPILFTATGFIPFKRETLDAYEIGSKNEFCDRKARLNAEAFYYDYKNSQAFNQYSFTQLISNAPARNVGGEVELQLAPTNNWLFSVGISYVDAIVKNIDLGTGPRSRKPANTPRWSGNALARYTWRLDSGSVEFQLDGNVLSSQYFALSNAPVTKQDGYSLTNARVHYMTANKKYELGLDVTNLFDKHYAATALDGSSTLGLTQLYPGNPRWTTASFTYNF